MLRAFIFFLLSFFLSYVFFMSGSNKLFPINEEIHQFLMAGAETYPAVFPQLGWDPTTFRLILGVTQLFSALILIGQAIGAVGNCVGFLATFTLMVEMSCAVYYHHATQTDPTLPLVLLAVLFVRLLFRKRSC